MTCPVGTCPSCGVGRLEPLKGTLGWTRCPACCLEFDHWRNAYDTQGRLLSRREGMT